MICCEFSYCFVEFDFGKALVMIWDEFGVVCCDFVIFC